jgi:hypothetical protein
MGDISSVNHVDTTRKRKLDEVYHVGEVTPKRPHISAEDSDSVEEKSILGPRLDLEERGKLHGREKRRKSSKRNKSTRR